MGQLADLEPVCSRFEIWNIEISYRSCHKMSFQTVRQTDIQTHLFYRCGIRINTSTKNSPKVREKWERSDHFASYNKSHFQCNTQSLKVSPEAPFNCKLLIFGIVSAPPTPPVFRVVLFHKEGSGKDTCLDSVCNHF